MHETLQSITSWKKSNMAPGQLKEDPAFAIFADVIVLVGRIGQRTKVFNVVADAYDIGLWCADLVIHLAPFVSSQRIEMFGLTQAVDDFVSVKRVGFQSFERALLGTAGALNSLSAMLVSYAAKEPIEQSDVATLMGALVILCDAYNQDLYVNIDTRMQYHRDRQQKGLWPERIVGARR